MDKDTRDALFAGLTYREVAEAVAYEMRRRRLNGCVYFFPQGGGPGAFASASPAGTMNTLSVAEQLNIFAQVASMGTDERCTVLPDETDDIAQKEWFN